jgi:hypothetical protein
MRPDGTSAQRAPCERHRASPGGEYNKPSESRLARAGQAAQITALHIPLTAMPHRVAEELISGPVHDEECYSGRAGSKSTHSLRRRQAIRDCSENSSMNPGEAVCENSPPDSEKEARAAS